VKRALWLVLVAGGAACAKVDTGSDTEPNANGAGVIVTGSLPFAASSFTAVSGGATCVLGGASTAVAYAAIVASDLPGMCSDLTQGVRRADARSVELVVFRVPASPSGIEIGIYPIVPTPGSLPAFALVEVSQNDAQCAPSAVIATGGSVQVTSVAGGELRAIVDAQLSDGGTIMGAFGAPACAATLGNPCSGQVGPATSTCAP
jgi:hypothetical protein